MKHRVISVDIGSTYTKGALFSLSEHAAKFVLEKRVVVPTIVSQPVDGVTNILKSLNYTKGDSFYYSSSAKGGLSIVAIGIVPELTLYMAELTAYSAGGKIVKVFDFKLTKNDIAIIDKLHLILFFLPAEPMVAMNDIICIMQKCLVTCKLIQQFFMLVIKRLMTKLLLY